MTRYTVDAVWTKHTDGTQVTVRYTDSTLASLRNIWPSLDGDALEAGPVELVGPFGTWRITLDAEPGRVSQTALFTGDEP